MKLVSLKDIPDEAVSHHPEIRKQIMVRNGELPHLKQLSLVRFLPGQRVESHAHDSLAEGFLILSGNAALGVDGCRHKLEPGFFALIEPGETHSLANSGEDELVLIVFGLDQSRPVVPAGEGAEQ